MPVMQYINQKSDYPLIMEIFPAGINKNAQFGIYEDDGETNNYKQDVLVKRSVECLSKKDMLEIVYSEKAENDFQPVKRNLIYQVHLKGTPTAVLLSGNKTKSFKLKSDTDWLSEKIDKAGWNWNKENCLLTICVPSTSQSDKITVQTRK